MRLWYQGFLVVSTVFRLLGMTKRVAALHLLGMAKAAATLRLRIMIRNRAVLRSH
jgi:hypothetical protein